MSSIWFFLTLVLDVFPVTVISLILLRKYLVCSLPAAIMRMLVPLLAYDFLICITYTRGLYPAGVMVGLRMAVCVFTLPLFYSVLRKFALQILYKCMVTLPFMLLVLQMAALTMNSFDSSDWPDFMAITCLRAVLYLLLGYPYYLLEKRVLIPNFEIAGKKVWLLFCLAQALLDLAMIVSIRTDYAENGIDTKGFLLQLAMMLASMSVTVLLNYSIRLLRDVELNREKQQRDELLLELNTKQYLDIQKNVEQMRHFRHDIKHHIRALEQLIGENKYEEVSSYLKKYAQDIPDGTNIKFCENLSINALLSYYYSMAIERKIRVSFDCASLAQCGIPDIDLNIILGNAIENAMEACNNMKQGAKYIKVSAKVMTGQVFITVDNSFDGVIIKSQGAYLSQKRQYQRKGYGNASMDMVAEKYCGIIKREVEANSYQLSVMMKDAM